MRRMFDNCWDKESYYKDGWKYNKIGQGLMIKKLYQHYTPDQYVLWINASIYAPYNKVNIVGKVFVITKDERILQIKSVTRTPYLNKSIYQISKTAGHRRAFGIPLIFDSFEEISQIKSIRIQWVIQNEKARKTEVLGVLNVLYPLEIVEGQAKDERIYTIDSYECCPFDFVRTNTTEDEREILDEYLLSFERVSFATNGKTYGYVKRSYQIVDEEDWLNRKEVSVEKLSYEKGQELLQKYVEPNYDLKNDATSVLVELEENLRLTPHYMAGIFAEPAFGFQRVSQESIHEYKGLL